MVYSELYQKFLKIICWQKMPKAKLCYSLSVLVKVWWAQTSQCDLITFLSASEFIYFGRKRNFYLVMITTILSPHKQHERPSVICRSRIRFLIGPLIFTSGNDKLFSFHWRPHIKVNLTGRDVFPEFAHKWPICLSKLGYISVALAAQLWKRLN